MPRIECSVIRDSSALIKLDDLFPECKTFASERTPRLVCLPQPNSCSACKSLRTLVRRVSGLFTASEWKLIVLYWYEGQKMRGLVAESNDPAEVRLIIINRYSFDLLKKTAEEYIIEMPLYN